MACGRFIAPCIKILRDLEKPGLLFFLQKLNSFQYRKEGDNYVYCNCRVSNYWSRSSHCVCLDLRSAGLVFASCVYLCRVHCTHCARLLDYRLCGCVGRAHCAFLLVDRLDAGDLRDLENRVPYSFCEYHMRVTIINDIL